MKAFLAVLPGMATLLFLRMVVEDHDNLFVAAEAVHALGTCVLIYRLSKQKTCAGLSLKSQELTAIFVAVRLYCSFVMEYDIHTLLDTETLGKTLWVIYMIRFKLRSSYMWTKTTLESAMCYFSPASAKGHAEHLGKASSLCSPNWIIFEPFTAHHVFALGVARFLSCAHWVIQLFDTRGHLLVALGYGLWPCLVLLSEIVQTFILMDFCYYYVKSPVGGQLLVWLPSGVV
ncbi:hypothetical protein CRYUN_Cryun28dG0106500 [Craigia yunnanensis]